SRVRDEAKSVRRSWRRPCFRRPDNGRPVRGRCLTAARARARDAAFEIENSTSIYSALLRFADLTMVAPNTLYPMFIVAPSDRHNRVRAFDIFISMSACAIFLTKRLMKSTSFLAKRNLA